MADSGAPGFEIFFWYAFVAPAGTPPNILNALNKSLNHVLADPSILPKFDEMSIKVGGATPHKVTDLMRSESAKWKKVIGGTGIKVE